MTEHDYEATVETERGTFTMSGDDPMVVSAQAARMPVIMHGEQIKSRTDLQLPIGRYMKHIAEEEKATKNDLNGFQGRHKR